ncbi:MAG: SUMF1/EgtB/PvdO family nonheme iron enzyme [Caldilineaceae bacterium]
MTALTYLDFDLSIEATGSDQTRYRVRSFSLAAGTANGEFTLPFSQQDLEILFLRLGRPRRGVRAIGSTEMQAAQTFGNTLFSHVFTGQVQSGLQRSLDQARQQNQGVRIRLRLSDAPALADLPWEFLYDPTQNHFLAYSTVTPLVRYLDLPNTVAPLAVQPPLKVLVMIANPRDHSYISLNVEEEWRKVQGALAELETRGLVQVTRLEAATLSALQRQLRRDQYHIFHFVGHGGFDNQSQSGVLLLEDEQGRSRLVSGHYLGALLRDQFSLRLALLNACEGARTSRADPFAGVAQHLVQQGIPAVIAMQFEITDQAAIALAHEFYSALADNYGVDAALAEARKALYAAGNDIEWGTPVLYMRAQSGQLFEFAVPAAQPPATKEVTKADNDKPNQREASRMVAPPAPRWRRSSWLAGLLTLLILVGVTTLVPKWMGLVTQWGGGATPPPTQTVAAASPTAPAVAVIETPTPTVTATDTAQPATPTVVDPPTVTATMTVTPLPPTPTDTVTPLPPIPTDTATPAPSPTATATVPPTRTPTPQPTPTPTLGIGATKVITLPSGLAMTFVYVPGGEFLMGSTEAQVDAAWALCKQYHSDCQRDTFTDELQQHSVSVEPFWIMQTEVTNAQYRAFIADKGYETETFWGTNGWAWRQANRAVAQPADWENERFKGDEQPVVGVSWYEARAYARWLAAETKLDIRLPTEAQWEKAARGPEGLLFPWGNAWDGTQVNYCDKNCDQSWKDEAVDDGYAYTAPVDSYPGGASPYGALNMAGNVWEWTSSLDMVYPYSATDGREDETATARRVVRGGAWGNIQYNVRAASRNRNTPVSRSNVLGFRVVVSVAPQ